MIVCTFPKPFRGGKSARPSRGKESTGQRALGASRAALFVALLCFLWWAPGYLTPTTGVLGVYVVILDPRPIYVARGLRSGGWK